MFLVRKVGQKTRYRACMSSTLPSSALRMQDICYRYVDEGKGGTLNFGYGNSSLAGTWRCHACVGVYFPVDKYRCFCAHINTWIETGDAPSYVPSAEEGERLRNLVLCRLRNEATWGGWKTSDVDASRMVLVCPKIEDFEEDVKDGRPVGYYVLEGIQEFLGLSESLVSRCDTEAQGFVVDHDKNQVMKIAKGHNATTGYLDAQSPNQWYNPTVQGKEQWAFSVLRK